MLEVKHPPNCCNKRETKTRQEEKTQKKREGKSTRYIFYVIQKNSNVHKYTERASLCDPPNHTLLHIQRWSVPLIEQRIWHLDRKDRVKQQD